MRRNIVALCILALLFLSGCGKQATLPDPPFEMDQFDPVVREMYSDLREAARTASRDREVKAKAVGRLGQWYHLFGSQEAARNLYLRSEELAPHVPQWPYYRGMLLASDLQFREAAAAFGRVLELAPDSVAARVRLAEVELERGRLEAARSLLGSAVEQDPECVRALAGLGRLETLRGSPAAALEYYERAIGIRPESDNLRYELGMTHRRLGNSEEAEAHLAFADLESLVDSQAMEDPWGEQLAEMDIGYVGRLRRAREALRSERPAVALGYFRQAGIANPHEAAAQLGVVRCLVALERWEAAWSEARSLFESFPDEPTLWFMASRACSRAPSCDRDPQNLLQRSLELDPGFVPALLRLARRHTIEGDEDAAISALRRAYEADRTSEIAVLRLSEALVQAGNVEEAISLLEAAQQTLRSPWAARIALRDLQAEQRLAP